MKNQKKNRVRAVAARALCLSMALSVMGMGFAKWQTNIDASGNVSASGKWDVTVTSAEITTSSGAAVTLPSTSSLQRAGVKADNAFAGRLTDEYTWLEDSSKVGTQSDRKAASYDAIFYAVNTAKYDLSSISYEKGETIKADESTIHLSDYLNLYYRYYGTSADFGSEQMAGTATQVVSGFLRDAEALLKQQHPDDWQQYAIVAIGTSRQTRFVVANVITEQSNSPVSIENGKVSFADVTFGIPGAWAEYKLTITNNGTVNANLSGAVIALNTENSDQLTLKAPDLSDETLKPGESCTVTFVVQVPESCAGELNATGSITVTLPYAQDSVEPAPEAGHTHA